MILQVYLFHPLWFKVFDINIESCICIFSSCIHMAHTKTAYNLVVPFEYVKGNDLVSYHDLQDISTAASL